MPELPEVETFKAGLAQVGLGRRIRAVWAKETRVFRSSPLELARALEGEVIAEVWRRGKYLAVKLGETGWVMVVHFGMSGRLCLLSSEEPLPRHAHLVLSLEGGLDVGFVDPRTFGRVGLAPRDKLAEVIPGFERLGPDAAEPLEPHQLEEMLHCRSRARLKALLLDQSFLAGLGNIYSDEVLWRAGLRWDRPAGSLSEPEVEALAGALRGVMDEAISLGGSTLADLGYLDLFGRAGAFQARHGVYGRAGQPCRRCGSEIAKVRFSGRHSFFCPGCQS